MNTACMLTLLLIRAAAYDVYIPISDDGVMLLSELEAKEQSRASATEIQYVSSNGRDMAFTVLDKFESFKDQSPIWTDDSNGRRTLSKMHYVVYPTWWANDATQDPSVLDTIDLVLGQTVDYYTEMSWGKHSLSYEFKEQFALNITDEAPTLTDTAAYTRAYVESQGLVEWEDYDGIIMMHDRAQSGNMDTNGGWGNVNGNFIWMAFDGFFSVTRHEVGHNYGHYHHSSNQYNWRIPGPKSERGELAGLDGWDMMSGGNGFDRSDFGAASKWFFNWIGDEAVVLMQPEGSSDSCPTCSASETVELKPFDNPTILPSSSNKMGVHIPIFGTDNDVLFSYWLSYRGNGNDGLAADGLSIHVVEFDLTGAFGARFDSLNYDAFGNTEETTDSFVLPETCYVVTPAAWIMDINPFAAEQVQPVVCVDSIDEGTSITVSVSFLDVDAAPTPTVSLASENEYSCSTAGTTVGDSSLDMSGAKVHLLHFSGTGFAGLVDVSLCLDTGVAGAVQAYFYDKWV